MRASTPGGRFTINYEMDSYSLGIEEDLRRVVGSTLPWYRFDRTQTVVDDVYDVGSIDGGRGYRVPRDLPYISAQVYHGQTDQSDRGFYNVDSLRLTINRADFERVFPDIVPEADNFLRDRAVFNDQVFRPSRIHLRGRVVDRYTIIVIDMVEVKDDELVNDPQFN